MAKKQYLQNLNSKPVIRDKKLVQNESIKKRIRILPELEELIPALKEEEFAQLEENIINEGCREALLLWPQEDEEFYLIDGHNRFNICRKHGIDFKVSLLEFKNIDEVKEYMILNQLGRRNLTPSQAAYYRGLRFQREKNQKGRYDRSQERDADTQTTSERLAKEYSVSKNTIERDAEYAKGLDLLGSIDPGLRKEVISGKQKVKKSLIQKLAHVDTIPEVDNGYELLAWVEKSSKGKTKPKKIDEDQLRRNREEAKYKLLELCKNLEDTSFVSETMVNNIIKAAKELKSTFKA